MTIPIARSIPLTLGALLLTGAVVLAQGADTELGRFEPFGQLEPKLDGAALKGAEMFFAQRGSAYLLLSPGLAQPLLVEARTQKVERLDAAKIRRNGNGTVELLLGARVETAGSFTVEANQVTAALTDGHRLTLGPKPALLGAQSAADLVAHDPSYAYRAGLYPPSGKPLEQLRQETRDVTVKVFFGSWCATCSRVVPWILAVEDALGDSKIRFEYHGLPRGMDDPAAKELGVDSVPTAIVLTGGQELGRRSSQGLGVPEKALLDILGGS